MYTFKIGNTHKHMIMNLIEQKETHLIHFCLNIPKAIKTKILAGFLT